MPWGNWQFWVVSLIAAWAAWSVVRRMLPARKSEEPGCAKCEVATLAREQARQESAATAREES